MKFTKLRLTNIGAFHGNYEFDLVTEDRNRNVILFGGQNGSGKTTILEALRLALFGPLSFGYKTDTSSYYEKIDAKLNTIAKRNGERNFHIILDIEMTEDFQRKTYTVKRGWERTKSSFRETLAIQMNGNFLKEKEMEIFQTKLREETPPQLFEFCLFDGERISQIISDDTLPSYLKETAKVMFNLDLFENLENDLNNLIRQDSIYGSLSEEEKQLQAAGERLEQLRHRKQTLVAEQEARELDIEEKNALLADLNKQFVVHGGLVKERRDALLAEMSNIDKQRVMMMEKTKDSIATILPLVLVKDLIGKTVHQMQEESVLDVRNNVQNMISSADIQALLESLHLSSNTPLTEASEQLYDGLLSKLSPETSDMYHFASYQERAMMDNLLRRVNKFKKETILQNYKKNSASLAQIQVIRKQIDENDSASDLKNLMDSIHALKNTLESRKLEAEQQLVTLSDLAEEINQQEKEYESLKNQVVRAKKAQNVFVISNRVLDVSRAFRDLQVKKKLHQVERETTNMLQSLFRKELFISKVSLDSQTFQLKLFSSSNEEINKDILSAGEKQLLLLSTVWAMVKCSQKRLPFVFDTLLGRLDQTHRKSLIKQLIPQCGEQAIILATDSEINEDLFQVIKPNVAKTYTIDYNTKTSTIDVTNHYFTYSYEEVNA